MLLIHPASVWWNPRQNPRPTPKRIQRGIQTPDSAGPPLCLCPVGLLACDWLPQLQGEGSRQQRSPEQRSLNTLRIRSRGPRESPAAALVMPRSGGIVVGIFSREDSSTYQWLIDLLLSPDFHRLVRDVRPVAITNSACGGSRKLAEEIARCSFAILYHSRKRGRLNITDVTDSLYDDELRDLSTKLGRDKVVVLVDDLDDDDVGAHGRIVKEQPLISQLAGLMVVFYQSDKPVYSTAAEERSSAQSYQRDLASRVKMNIERMKEKMSSGSALSRGNGGINWVLVGLSVGAIVLVVVVVILCLEFIAR